jgi:hypothetical protein
MEGYMSLILPTVQNSAVASWISPFMVSANQHKSER